MLAILTARQLEALRLASEGSKELASARAMGISKSAFVMHLQRARWKLNAKNTAHAINIAWQKGILP